MNARPPVTVLRRLTVALVVVLAASTFGPASCRYVHGLSLVTRAAQLGGVWRRIANVDTVTVREVRTIEPPALGVPLPVRLYVPAKTRATLLIVSGLHAAGIDEPRLMALSRQLAEARVTVVTPDIPELRRFEISPVVTDHIERMAVWLAADSGLAPDGRIGLIGISFSGGLSVVAAGRPTLRARLGFVLSFGGHDDLGRVFDYLCRGPTHGGAPPHDYGLAIALLNVADRLVPPEQVGPLREAVRDFLWASHLDTVDKPAAQRAFATLRDVAAAMPEPSATLMTDVNDRAVDRLGPKVHPHLAWHAAQPALSPSRSPLPRAPVFLLHGRDDNVIPAQESEALATRLRPHVPVRLLVTPLISHAAADRPARVVDVLQVAGFWGDLLAR